MSSTAKLIPLTGVQSILVSLQLNSNMKHLVLCLAFVIYCLKSFICLLFYFFLSLDVSDFLEFARIAHTCVTFAILVCILIKNLSCPVGKLKHLELTKTQ